jgi:membrane-bound lytic murein transglycosylase D
MYNAPAFLCSSKGDNLGSIAKKYDVTVAEIKNGIHLSNDNVQLGASLQVVKSLTVKKELVSAPERKALNIFVLQGDNLRNIAKKFGASLTDLKQWNNLQDNTIGVGTTLIVAKDEIVINPIKQP